MTQDLAIAEGFAIANVPSIGSSRTKSEQMGRVVIERLSDSFEQASAAYAAANGLTRDADWFVLKMAEEFGELVQSWNRVSGRGRAKGLSEEALRESLADETADLLGHVLLFARANDLDLEAAIARKWRFAP